METTLTFNPTHFEVATRRRAVDGHDRRRRPGNRAEPRPFADCRRRGASGRIGRGGTAIKAVGGITLAGRKSLPAREGWDRSEPLLHASGSIAMLRVPFIDQRVNPADGVQFGRDLSPCTFLWRWRGVGLLAPVGAGKSNCGPIRAAGERTSNSVCRLARFLFATGWRCPACGMTTSWAHATHGQLADALQAHVTRDAVGRRWRRCCRPRCWRSARTRAPGLWAAERRGDDQPGGRGRRDAPGRMGRAPVDQSRTSQVSPNLAAKRPRSAMAPRRTFHGRNRGTAMDRLRCAAVCALALLGCVGIGLTMASGCSLLATAMYVVEGTNTRADFDGLKGKRVAVDLPAGHVAALPRFERLARPGQASRPMLQQHVRRSSSSTSATCWSGPTKTTGTNTSRSARP